MILIPNFVFQAHFFSQVDNHPRRLALITVKGVQLLLHFISLTWGPFPASHSRLQLWQVDVRSVSDLPHLGSTSRATGLCVSVLVCQNIYQCVLAVSGKVTGYSVSNMLCKQKRCSVGARVSTGTHTAPLNPSCSSDNQSNVCAIVLCSQSLRTISKSSRASSNRMAVADPCLCSAILCECTTEN